MTNNNRSNRSSHRSAFQEGLAVFAKNNGMTIPSVAPVSEPIVPMFEFDDSDSKSESYREQF